MKSNAMNIVIAAVMLSAGILLSGLLSGCGGERRLYPFRWESTGARADSLTLAMEKGLYMGEELDSLSSLLALLDKEGEKEGRLRGRADFFRTAIMERDGREAVADSLLHDLLERTDSAADPYLYNRLRLRLGTDVVSPSTYNEKFLLLEYFRSVDDPFQTAAAAIDMGNLLKEVNDPDGALMAYSEADSLLRIAGFPEIAIPIGINVANALQIKGDSAGGVRLLHKLLQDPYISSDLSLQYTILSNLFTSTLDTVAAREMVTICEEEGEPVESDCKLATFLSETEYDKGNYKEALRLARAGYVQATIDDNADVRGKSMQSMANAFYALGMIDSAYYYLGTGVTFVDSIELARMPQEIQATETGRIIREKKMERELQHGKKMLWVITFIFFLFLCMVVAAGVVVWRIHALRLDRARASVEREKAHRRLMATQILMEEKDALLNTLNRDLRHLEEKGEISSGTKGHIANPIKTHIVQSSGRETFLDTFSELHPDFTERLKEQAPDLTETDLRLAKYIAVGLDNKQIASTLGIRPESVKQARWRLRSKLHLPSGASLEEHLSSLVD
ncbi:MAG: LuxR C-terminal-related transcriptional regulator [Muribaculaceae bacterium]|nr:LuxR C-terminal-related transcriptional regulator [Muribaculaceae bacterium]